MGREGRRVPVGDEPTGRVRVGDRARADVATQAGGGGVGKSRARPGERRALGNLLVWNKAYTDLGCYTIPTPRFRFQTAIGPLLSSLTPCCDINLLYLHDHAEAATLLLLGGLGRGLGRGLGDGL